MRIQMVSIIKLKISLERYLSKRFDNQKKIYGSKIFTTG